MLRSAAPIVKGLTLTSTRRFSVISVADSAAGGSTTGDVGTYPPFLPDEDDPAMYLKVVETLRAARARFSHLGPHKPTLTSDESAATRRAAGGEWANTTLASGAKAMLVLNAKSDEVPACLVVLAADRKLDFKKLRSQLPKGKSAKLATADEVLAISGCLPGAVPPFGSLFAAPGGGGPVRTMVDASLRAQGEFINFNCGLRTRSVRMTFEDYSKVEQPAMCEVTE